MIVWRLRMEFVKSDEGQHNILLFLQKNRGNKYSARDLANIFNKYDKLLNPRLRKLYKSNFINRETRKIPNRPKTYYYWVD